MNGYLMFLNSLSRYQQRAEIARLAFRERWGGSSLEEDILKNRAVSAFSKTLGVDPRSWEFDLKHYAEEPDLFGAPVFRDDQCIATFSFCYGHLDSSLSPSFPTRGVDDPRSRSRTTSWSKGLPHKSDVLGLAQKLSARADSGRRLGRQGKFKVFEQQLVVGLRVSVAA